MDKASVTGPLYRSSYKGVVTKKYLRLEEFRNLQNGADGKHYHVDLTFRKGSKTIGELHFRHWSRESDFFVDTTCPLDVYLALRGTYSPDDDLTTKNRGLSQTCIL
jgi:hypothetical protein